jgi:apolipoprotein N-acyltransferase
MPGTAEQSYSLIKVGAIFTLFGLLCPFFWIRFSAGDYGSETVVYGFHSVVFILLGAVFIVKGWYDQKNIKKNQDNSL